MIKGHIKQQKFFRQAVAARQLSHAYILSGPEGIGKKQFAKELGRSLLCQEKTMFQPCDCPACKQVRGNTHPDYYLYESREDLKIENIRNISGISELTTYSGGWKVIILDNAHILCQAGADAANALLKTLEEPGENTLFLLITHKLDRVLPTIQSRCLTIGFETLSPVDLEAVLKESGITPGEDLLRYAEGSVSRALMLKDFHTAGLLQALETWDAVKAGEILLKISSKEMLGEAAGILQRYFIDRYKVSGNAADMLMVQYLMQFARNLDYNVNLSIMTLDMFVKLSETLTTTRTRV